MYNTWKEVLETIDKEQFPLYDKEKVKEIVLPFIAEFEEDDPYDVKWINKMCHLSVNFICEDCIHLDDYEEYLGFYMGLYTKSGALEDQGYTEIVARKLFEDLGDIISYGEAENYHMIYFDNLREKFSDFPKDDLNAYKDCSKLIIGRVMKSLTVPSHNFTKVSTNDCKNMIIQDLKDNNFSGEDTLNLKNWSRISKKKENGMVYREFLNKKTKEEYLVIEVNNTLPICIYIENAEKNRRFRAGRDF